MSLEYIDINRSVPYISQQDSDGCAIASSAMVINCYWPTDVSYDDIKTANGGTTYMNWTTVANAYSMNFTRIPSSGDSTFNSLKSTIFNKLYNLGEPVILRASGSGDHYVVVKGFSGYLNFVNGYPDTSTITADMFKINDPAPNLNNYTLADLFAEPNYGGDAKALYMLEP